MRAESGHIALLDRHLARLTRGALVLGYPLDVKAARTQVAEQIGEGTEGARLTLADTGEISVGTWPLSDEPMRTAWLDPEPLAEAGTWRCALKTTDRGHYRARFERARQRGADEALLVIASGEVIEGTRTAVCAESDGRRWTPPLSAGGLPGVMRAHVLATDPRAGEKPMTPSDLREADALYLSNALRGWMPVTLVE